MAHIFDLTTAAACDGCPPEKLGPPCRKRDLRELATRDSLYYLDGMDTIKNLLTNLCNLLGCACELLRYAVILLWAIFSPRAVLAAKLLPVESQLAASKLSGRRTLS